VVVSLSLLKLLQKRVVAYFGACNLGLVAIFND
jgi:hypothetical protein